MAAPSSESYVAPAPQPVEQAEVARPPTLVSGRVQHFRGYMTRQTTVLKRWKQNWIEIEPGQNRHVIRKFEKRQSVVASLNDGSYRVETLSDDPKNKLFLVFRLVDTSDGKEIVRFRAHDAVSMRKVMASLASEAEGLFSKKSDSEVVVEATHGLWDVYHPSEDELYFRQKMFDAQSKPNSAVTEGTDAGAPTGAPPSYEVTVHQLPIGFYFQEDTGVKLPADARAELAHPGAAMSMYDPNAPLPKAYRRPWHDTFKPPRGPPVFFPVSIGYGAEIGLLPGIQALWDFNTKSYFFLDHVKRITSYEDPRLLIEPPPVVQKSSFNYGPQIRETHIPPSVCREGSVIEATTARALARPHGFIVHACGVHGAQGAAGQKGSTGTIGFPGHHGVGSGSSGGPGGPGGPGGRGTDGLRGIDGSEASDIVVNITGNADELKVSGSVEVVANLGGVRVEEILLINCRGGNGGHGGRGGDGGTGGVGGPGGHGARGRDGMSSSSGRGGDGGPGGNGGPGGPGGQGGPGGRGGDGGHAGYGGACVLQSYDPTLLMLVDADVMCGSLGVSGSGGDGGSGGFGGPGGSGGSGGHGGHGGTTRDSQGHTQHHSSGFSGSSGYRGSNGFPGSRGQDGPAGINGNPASKGGILWVVSSPDGGVLYQAGTRYDAGVTSYNVTSAIDDGIFEPNERILVSGVTVFNDGGLPLPEGASLFMPSTQTIKFEPTRYSLPGESLCPGMTHVIPVTYYGRIFDQPPPNVPGPFVSKAYFKPRAELLGRPFEKSFLAKELVVQYPVKLEYLRCSENLGRGEVSVLEIGVQNISTLAYGDCQGSGGKVSLQLHLDARLIPVGSADIGFNSVPYTVTYDPTVRDSMYIQIHEIPPQQTVNVQITIQMESRAELFDRCFWQADLYLRDKLIEYNFEKVRVTPFYTPSDPVADVLMITNEHITRKEFVFWQKILETMNVSVDFWDTTRYNGLSVDKSTNTRHQVSWEGKYLGKMILHPHCQLDLLYGVDVPRHFHGTDYRDNVLKEQQSSMLLFLPEAPQRGRTSDRYYDRGDLQVLRHISIANGSLDLPEEVTYGGKHLFPPGSCFSSASPYLKWERNYLKKLEKDVPKQAPVVISRQVAIQKVGLISFKYGSVDIRKVPILRSSKFVVVDGIGGSMVDMSLDDINLVPSTVEIPLSSNYGQVLLLTLHCLPLINKIQLLRTNPDQPSEVGTATSLVFHLPNGASLSLVEMAMISVADEIADELYCYEGSSKRLRILSTSVEQNPAAFTTHGNTIMQGLELAKEEAKRRKAKVSHSSISPFIADMERHARNIQRLLRNSGSSKKDLPPLSSLLSSEHVHRSHQHWVESDRWNLLGQ